MVSESLRDELASPPARRSSPQPSLVLGGASYHGLVALEAHAHGRVLLSLDRRAQETYRRLHVEFQAI